MSMISLQTENYDVSYYVRLLPSALASYRVSIHHALAGPRFRLAGYCLAFSLMLWLSAMRVVFGGEREAKRNGAFAVR